MRREYRHVQWIEFDPAGTVFRFLLGNLPQIITIRLHQDEGGRWQAQSSHAIKTPLQQVPYWSFRSPDGDKDYTLWQAVTALTMDYRQAIEAGCRPCGDWLVSYFKCFSEGKDLDPAN